MQRVAAGSITTGRTILFSKCVSIFTWRLPLNAKHEADRNSGQTLRRETMNRMNMFQALRSGRFSALVALVGLGLLFTASGAKAAGCALPYKAGATPSIPLLSP